MLRSGGCPAFPKLLRCRSCFHLLHLYSQLPPVPVMAATARRTARAARLPPRVNLTDSLMAAVRARDLGAGMAIHALMIKDRARFVPTVSLWNVLLGLYRRCGRTRSAWQLFDKMHVRDVISFNTMISSCFHAKDSRSFVRAMELYSLMCGAGLKPTNITLSVLLAVTVDSPVPLGLVEQLHAQSVKFQLDSDCFVGSALVSGYAKCQRLDEATFAFNRIAEVDDVAWNVMIDCCACGGGAENTAEAFCRMRRHSDNNVGVNGFSLTSVLKTCLEPKFLGLGMQLHACALKSGLDVETPVCNALITMYTKCQKDRRAMVSVFCNIPEPDIISWTAIISGLTKNELNEEAICFYKEMLKMGFLENQFCFASVLPAFTSLASIQDGRQVHCRSIKSVFGLDKAVGNALIDMYFKCGSLEDAQLVFQNMKSCDVVSWTVLIAGLGHHGKAWDAVGIFQAMLDKGFKPDAVTFLAGLSACSHGGLVDKGLQIFYAMNNVYDIKPKKEHYATVIDLLGRAGKLAEAEQFIMETGLDSDILAWETLLSACQIHGEMNLAERSAKKVIELQPKKEGAYVMLSNIYAEKRMWVEKCNLRHQLDVTGLKKETGYSCPTALEIY